MYSPEATILSIVGSVHMRSSHLCSAKLKQDLLEVLLLTALCAFVTSVNLYSELLIGLSINAWYRYVSIQPS